MIKYQTYCVYNKYCKISGRTCNRSDYGWPNGEDRTCSRARRVDGIYFYIEVGYSGQNNDVCKGTEIGINKKLELSDPV